MASTRVGWSSLTCKPEQWSLPQPSKPVRDHVSFTEDMSPSVVVELLAQRGISAIIFTSHGPLIKSNTGWAPNSISTFRIPMLLARPNPSRTAHSFAATLVVVPRNREKLTIRRPSLSLRAPPAPAFPGLPTAALLVFNLTHPSGGGDHLTSIIWFGYPFVGWITGRLVFPQFDRGTLWQDPNSSPPLQRLWHSYPSTRSRGHKRRGSSNRCYVSVIQSHLNWPLPIRTIGPFWYRYSQPSP